MRENREYFTEFTYSYGNVCRKSTDIPARLWYNIDTLKEKSGTYKIYDVMTKEILKAGSFTVDKNQNIQLGGIRMMYSDKKILVIEWKMDGTIYYNHYLCGYPAFDFETYKAWLAEYRRITE